MKAPDGFYSETEVAEFLGLSLETLRKKYSTDKRVSMPRRKKAAAAYLYNKNLFHAWLEEQPESGAEITHKKSKAIYEKQQFFL